MLTIVVALPAAYVLGRFRFRGRGLVRALVVVPFVLPTVVVALAFVAVLPDGVERGWAPILVAHAFFNVAVVVRIVGTFWASLDPRVGEAAATLGAGAWRALPRDHAAAARARAGRRGGDRLPLLVHVVRRRPHPRRPALRDDRGGDLQPGRPPLRPARRGRALARPARVRRAGRLGRDAPRAAARRAQGSSRPERDVLRPAAHGRRAGSSSARASAALALFLGLPARRARRALARRRRRARARRLPRRSRARRASLLAAPWEAIVNSIALRGRGDADRGRRRRARRVRGAPTRAGAARRRPRPASARRLGGDARLRVPDRVRHARRSTSARRRGSSPSRRRSSRSRSSCGSSRRRCARSTRGSARPPRCSARRRARVRREIDLPIVSARPRGRGRRSRSRSRSASSARRSFLARPDSPTLPVAIFRFLGPPGRAQRRAGVRARRRAHGADGRVGAPRRARPRSDGRGWF